ncbi:MAG: hypothetical protein KatS3mg008_0178 [Acidimicrobiales bacterium]|nr:MAG: hypothetical protein KatS3mg008_0178 [Acidimicrobiales bacterium]
MDRSSALRLLGLTDASSVQEIRAAFRRKVLRHHPDHDPDPTATETTRLLVQARHLLEKEFFYGDRSEEPNPDRSGNIPSSFLEACSLIGRVVRHEDERGRILIEAAGRPGCLVRVEITALGENTWLLHAECHVPDGSSTVDLRQLLEPLVDAMRRWTGART